MTNNGNGRNVLSWFRLITPVLVTIGIFLMNNMYMTVKDINEKLFSHLTNEDIHIPRSMLVSMDSFTMYQTMRDKEMKSICDNINEIKVLIKNKFK